MELYSVISQNRSDADNMLLNSCISTFPTVSGKNTIKWILKQMVGLLMCQESKALTTATFQFAHYSVTMYMVIT